MKKIAIGLCLLSLCATASFSDVIFAEGDQRTLDFIIDTTSFSNGTLIGVGYGLNGQLELDLNYASVKEGASEGQIIMPGLKYYFLKPRLNNPWFVTFDGDVLIISQTSGTGSSSGSGYFLAGNIGFDWKVLKGFKIIPYAGLLYAQYEIGSSSINSVNTRVGTYIGIPIGGGSVGYFKPVIVHNGTEASASLVMGYHFALK
ncbi:hypothetical protein ACFL4J_00070 [Candidatus Margulisiibacteriota bacterium]